MLFIIEPVPLFAPKIPGPVEVTTHENVLFTATLVVRSYPTSVPEHIAEVVTFVPTGVAFTVTTALPVGAATVQPLASVTEMIV